MGISSFVKIIRTSSKGRTFNRLMGGVVLMVVFSFLFSACPKFAHYSTILPTSTTPSSDNCYLYGKFEMKKNAPMGGGAFGLVIKKIGANEKYTIKFPKEKGISAIKVSPGEYQLEKIVGTDFTSEILFELQIERNPEWKSVYRKPFTLSPGKAYYLGYVYAVYSSGVKYSSQGARISQHFKKDTKAFKKKYPGFKEMDCVQVFK